MSAGKKLILSFVIPLLLYLVYSTIVYSTIYSEWEYCIFTGKIFYFDLVRYTIFIVAIAIAIYIVGLKLEWKFILFILTAQIMGYSFFYYFIYLHEGKAHYMGGIKINHNSFLEWLDYLVGLRRWVYTRLIELILLVTAVYITMRMPKPKWSLLNKGAYNDKYNSPLDQSIE